MLPDVAVVALGPDGEELPEVGLEVGWDRLEREPTGSPSAWRLRVTACLRADAGVPARVGRLQIALALPARDPHWLIPGLFYGENRPEACDRRFPRFEAGTCDPAGLVSDHWSFRADRAATPAVFAWGDEGGWALVTEHESALGLSGLGFGAVGETATIHLRFPYAEEPVTYYGSATPRPSSSETFTFEPGIAVEVRADIYRLPADRHAYAPVLREVWQARHEEHPLAPWMDVDHAAELTAYGLWRWHYDPDPGVLLETAAFDREIDVDGVTPDRQAMHVGWVSGVPWAYALQRHGTRTGNESYIAAARSVLDFICANLAPCGTFYGTWYRKHGWKGSWSPIPGAVHARTLGEATYYLVRAIEIEPRAAWIAAARANLEVMVARQRADGNLGALHHVDTGEVLSWEGAAGLMWIPALLAAADTIADDAAEATRWREAAARAGDYYARFVVAEFIHGAPEDVDLAPTSEDGYAAVLAYLALHRAGVAWPDAAGGDTAGGEATASGGELGGGPASGRWLDLARRAADWTLTFRYTYNVRFDPLTMLGHYGFATRGADQASPSNQHLHNFGLICTAALAELSRELGDDHYAARAAETLACFRQFIARQDGDFNAYRGMVTERYYQTECFQPKGMLHTLSHAWCLGATLLGCEEELTRG